MKILITGGTGFLGRHCAVRLNSLGHEVTVLARNETIGMELKKLGINFLNGNILDSKAVHRACAGQEQVVHAAALNKRCGVYREFYETNVSGTQHIIDACLSHGVERLVHLSTSSMYLNYQDRLSISEAEPLPQPKTAYSKTKLMAEHLIDKASEQGLSTITLRPRLVYGRGDNNVLGRLLKFAKQGTIYLPNGGDSLIDITYIDNAVDAILLSLKATSAAFGKKFNVTNGAPITVHKLIEALAKSVDINIIIKTIPFSIAYLLASIQELRSSITKSEPKFTREMVGILAHNLTLDLSESRKYLSYEPKIDRSPY